MKQLSLIIFLISAQLALGQKETNNWFFGCSKGVTFNSGKLVSVYTSGADTWHSGGSTISTKNGRLIFYSASHTVVDSTNKAMPNGILKNNDRTIQSSLIVPWPDSSHLYYVFTPGVSDNDSLSYSIVNMKLRGGLGDVVTGKKNINLPTLNSGKVAAVRHNNRREYWVLTPQGNSDSINTYLVTSKGIVTPPVKSPTSIYISAGQVYPGSPNKNYYGYLKFSPDGRKLCNVNSGTTSMISDFDASTGKVSNVWEFMAYREGVEFSTKSNYLYAYSFPYVLSQYNLSSKSKTDFLASRKTVDSAKDFLSYPSMQLAPDGKIYIYHYDSKYLDVIHAPDSLGKKAHFQKDYFAYMSTIETNIHLGLPNFVSSLLYKPNFDVRQNCSRDSVFFTIKETYELDSAKWDFGDPSSGSLNTSNKTTKVFHSYKNSGTYKVRLVSYHTHFTDTIYESFFVNYSKPFLGNDATVCISQYILLMPKGNYSSYKWSTGNTSKSLYITKKGRYHLTVTDGDGCKTSDTIFLKNAYVKANFSINDSDQCFKNNQFEFKETSVYSDDKRKESLWYFEDRSLVNDSQTIQSFSKNGVYSVKLIAQSQLGCIDSITKTIRVYPQTQVGFTVNDSIQCLISNSFDFKNTSVNTDSLSYQWDLADVYYNKKDVEAKTFNKTGALKIRLFTTSSNNCKDTLTKYITVVPSPVADFSFGPACHLTPVNFTFTGTKQGNTLFLWNLGPTTSTLENPSQLYTTPGSKKVTLTVTSDNGCSDGISKTVELKQQAKANFDANDACESDSVNFKNKSTDAISYKWKFSDGDYSYNNSPKHLYKINGVTQTYNVTLVAVVPDGCSDSLVKAVTVKENPISDFSYILKGSNLDLKASQISNTKYHWKFGTTDSFTTSKVDYTHTIKSNDQFSVCLSVTNIAGCISQTCKTISVGIYNLVKSNGIKISPNPNQGSFIIEIENLSKDISIEIYDLLGNLIKSVETNSQPKSNYFIALDSHKGIYIVRVKNGGLIFNEKIIVGY